MAKTIDIVEQLQTLVAPLEGSTQGEAVKFAIQVLTEIAEVRAEVEKEKANQHAIRREN